MKLALEFSFIALLASLAVVAASSSTSSGKMGASSSTSSGTEVDLECYDEDEEQHITQLMESSCDYNIFMCCWTKNDGEGMEDNTDVCSYTDSSVETFDYPGDIEGDVHCHGFGWPQKSDYRAYIEPLYHFVRNYDHKEYRGYFGSVADAPECGCVEDMPVVSRADCSTYSKGGLTGCTNNDLRRYYTAALGSFAGDLTVNLVGTCDE